MEKRNLPIGMMDSGVGGVSVLREVMRFLPHEDFVYYGDNANAPYGGKTAAEIERLTRSVVLRLLGLPVKAVVVACNTATSAAVSSLRECLHVPIIGMEPALKPASALRKDGAVLVLATQTTLQLPKFQTLMALYGRGVLPIACPGLMEWVERGELDGPGLQSFLHGLLAPYIGTKVDAVVLGCTHYVFLRAVVQRMFPQAHVIDGNAGTARQLARRLQEEDLLRNEGMGSVRFETSGEQQAFLSLMQHLLVVELNEEEQIGESYAR